MKQCPEAPTLAETGEFSGHVWVQELPTGGQFRFTVAPSGFVTFATPDGSFDAAASVPAAFRRAAHQIAAQLDRDALEAATDAPDDITFCGIATRNEGVDYDWAAVPPFVGTDVWSGRSEAFLSPDAATGVFDRLGLPTLPAVEKEQPAAHIDLARFDESAGFPPSAWRDGPAAGVLIRDKAGNRAAAWCVEPGDPPSDAERHSAAELAAAYATTDRIEQTVTAMSGDGTSVTVDGIRDRLVADVAREAYAELFADGAFIASLTAFESAVAERVQRHQSPAD
ncbi:hypothetical protein [Haloarcula salinisoli]|uniref:Uncharacterized protein n=1 Tax=Haloarcula salinisoli TaxID=2487746 RepID=A0A8J7YRF3_9EURY|nr:hypothetical protein [Halomicroarcula salinisoli]MBX0288303.1 hypothetical protein [Halomicroarcula salinisoli]MBX0305963.1 hypothetical protein [Halomicroarcula salinisoli]